MQKQFPSLSRRSLFLLIGLAVFIAAGCSKVENAAPRYNPQKCMFCTKNPGKCAFCKGNGIRHEGTSKVSYSVKCSFCNGTGVCTYCNGKKSCRYCDGTAKIKTWNWWDSLKETTGTVPGEHPPTRDTAQVISPK